jgi:hypothetical protein
MRGQCEDNYRIAFTESPLCVYEWNQRDIQTLQISYADCALDEKHIRAKDKDTL